MRKPKYLMWFTRFSEPHLETQYSRDDCYELKHMLDNADTGTFDQYGVLQHVEHIGHGIIPDDEWDKGLEAFAKEDAEYLEVRAKTAPKRVGWIEVAPPEGGRVTEVYRSYFDEDEMQKDFWWLCQALGDDRVELRRPWVKR